ncbi:MAG: hypothetical protein KGQ58_08240 [Proteobacteria bacterium]|nr:hypothetical protein [Pseudomonadota bacterium]MDE3208651.1 hypothetical protein [Pseudomonadota bacterium]
MKPIVTVITVSLLAMLTGCSTLEGLNPWGKHESAPTKSQNSSSTQTKWKTVSRMENGTWVTYQVPITEKVPNTYSSQSGSQQGPSIADEGSPTPINGTTTTNNQGNNSPAASVNNANQTPIKPGDTTEAAEVALGQAEIIVREAQSRYQTAETMLDLARKAEKAGDNAEVIKYSQAAIALSQSR